MSNSLKITGGDLTVGSGRAFETVSQREKLGQDLRLWVLERMGTDPATPNYGTTLDGGRVNGQEVDSLIGQMLTNERIVEVRAQLANMCSQYQQVQLAKIQRDMTQFAGQTTLTPEEILQVVQNIEVKSSGTTIIARITILTMAGSQISITIPVAV